MDSVRKRRISRLGIVVIAAILVEVISIVQYERVKAAMEEEMGVRARVVLLVLLALAILAFMIERFARSEAKLRKASEEQARMGGELAVARQIQQEMLPTAFPPFVSGSLEPAREVGGDLFDFFIRDGITLVNEIDEVNRLSDFVSGFCDRLEIDGKTTSALRLALEETVVNVINYAYPSGYRGEVSILAESDRKHLRFTVSDSGTPFDPTTVLEADTTLDAEDRPIGGLGVLLTRKIMDSITYTRRQGQNVLSLTKYL